MFIIDVETAITREHFMKSGNSEECQMIARAKM